MPLLTVQNLSKKYEKFHLDNISFSLEEGYIMGFIGINGAGKTTTLKSLLNIVHPDSGSVTLLGKEYRSDEVELKRHIGIMFGDMDFYTRKKVKTVTDVVKRFYPDWDDTAYTDYCRRFSIDQDKRISELSRGMRTKYALTLSLSHNARLLILDEPTSGLDPAARDELLEIFQELVEEGNRSILFSTHITSDLEKCADYITYIHEGHIIGSAPREDFIDSYRMVRGTRSTPDEALAAKLIASRTHRFGFTGLIKTSACSTEWEDVITEKPTLEDIMIYYAKKETPHDQPAL